jgi:hypothetical protein
MCFHPLMKKVLAICLCLIPLFGLSQNFKSLDSLTLIKFGCNRTTTVETTKAHHGVWDVQHSLPQYYVFTHLTFDKKSKSSFAVKFTGGKAYEVDYVITPDLDVNVLGYYCEIIQKISQAYGPPKSGKQFKSPCKGSDINEIKAIKLGFAYYSSCWYAGSNSILLSIDPGLHVILAIQDNKLTNGAFERQDASN